MNYENEHSAIYKELHPMYWDHLLENPKLGDILGIVIASLIAGGIGAIVALSI